MLSEEMQVVVYTLLNLLALYTLDNAISIFLERKQNYKIVFKIVPYVIYAIAGIFTFFLSDTPFINTLIACILVLIMTLNFEGGVMRKITIAFLWILFKTVVEIVVILIYTRVIGITINDMVSNDISLMVANSYNIIGTLIIIKLTQLIVKKKIIGEKIEYVESIQISIIPFCSIVILYSFLEISLIYNITNWIIVVSIVLIVFINVFFFYLFDKLKEVEQLKFDKELHQNQSDYYIELEESVSISFDRIRTVKHDLKHELLYLKTRTKDNPVEALEEIDQKLDSLIGAALNDEFSEYTKNIRLNRFLNYKALQIKKVGINFEIKTNVGEHSKIDGTSIYVILGNAIDNAVSNYSDIKSTDKKITIKILEESDNLFIKISNPYANKLVFKNDLPITSKSDKTMHGVGLKSVKRMVDEKNGYFKINTNNNIFSLEIILFDEI